MIHPDYKRILAGNETVPAGYDVMSTTRPDGSEWRYVRQLPTSGKGQPRIVASGIVNRFRLTKVQSTPAITATIGQPQLETSNDSTARFLPLNDETNRSQPDRLRFAFTFTGAEPPVPEGSRPRYYHAAGTPYYFLVHAVIENPPDISFLKLAGGQSPGHFDSQGNLLTKNPNLTKAYRTIAGGLVAHAVPFEDLPKDLLPYQNRAGVFVSMPTLTAT